MADDLAANSQNNCIKVIYAFRDAADCQATEQIRMLTWSDGWDSWPVSGRRDWSKVVSSGPCGKYDTYLREIEAFPVVQDRQQIQLKAITRRMSATEHFTGDYTVTKVEFTCLRRDGQWRIFSRDVKKREDLVNHQAAAQFEKSERKF